MSPRLKRLAFLGACLILLARSQHLFATPNICEDVCGYSACDHSCYIDQTAFESDISTTCYDFGTYDLSQVCCGDGFCSSAAGESPESCSYDCHEPIAPTCGANGCETGETCNTCPTDCGACAPAYDNSCNHDGNCQPGEDQTCDDCKMIGFCRSDSDCPSANGNDYQCVADRCVLRDLPAWTITCNTNFDCSTFGWDWICDYSEFYDSGTVKVCLPPWKAR